MPFIPARPLCRSAKPNAIDYQRAPSPANILLKLKKIAAEGRNYVVRRS
jgi:hypothetical protein